MYIRPQITSMVIIIVLFLEKKITSGVSPRVSTWRGRYRGAGTRARQRTEPGRTGKLLTA